MQPRHSAPVSIFLVNNTRRVTAKPAENAGDSRTRGNGDQLLRPFASLPAFRACDAGSLCNPAIACLGQFTLCLRAVQPAVAVHILSINGGRVVAVPGAARSRETRRSSGSSNVFPGPIAPTGLATAVIEASAQWGRGRVSGRCRPGMAGAMAAQPQGSRTRARGMSDSFTLLTGGSSGIGAATCQLLLAPGTVSSHWIAARARQLAQAASHPGRFDRYRSNPKQRTGCGPAVPDNHRHSQRGGGETAAAGEGHRRRSSGAGQSAHRCTDRAGAGASCDHESAPLRADRARLVQSRARAGTTHRVFRHQGRHVGFGADLGPRAGAGWDHG